MRAFLVGQNIDPALLKWATANGFTSDEFSTDGQINVLAGPVDLVLNAELKEWISSFGYERIFESCFLSTEIRNGRAGAVQNLFSQIGPAEYSASIDVSQNIGCYDELFSRARLFVETRNSNVIDLGCGPGTILSSQVVSTAGSVTGFDFVPANLLEASARGLCVISERELQNIPKQSVDIILCVYVLHYESMSTEFIELIINLMRPGGVWIANFHKSKGLHWFRSLIDAYSNVRAEEFSSTFGPILVVVRLSNE